LGDYPNAIGIGVYSAGNGITGVSSNEFSLGILKTGVLSGVTSTIPTLPSVALVPPLHCGTWILRFKYDGDAVTVSFTGYNPSTQNYGTTVIVNNQPVVGWGTNLYFGMAATNFSARLTNTTFIAGGMQDVWHNPKFTLFKSLPPVNLAKQWAIYKYHDPGTLFKLVRNGINRTNNFTTESDWHEWATIPLVPFTVYMTYSTKGANVVHDAATNYAIGIIGNQATETPGIIGVQAGAGNSVINFGNAPMSEGIGRAMGFVKNNTLVFDHNFPTRLGPVHGFELSPTLTYTKAPKRANNSGFTFTHVIAGIYFLIVFRVK